MQAEPSADERAAVDELLGAPESAWDGALERSAFDHRVARGGAEARDDRHLLLPALHALQGAVGWISPGGMNYVCERLTVPPAEAYGVATFYAMFSTEERPAHGAARLRRHRVPAAAAGPTIDRTPDARTASGVVREPVPRAVRAGARGADPDAPVTAGANSAIAPVTDHECSTG